MGKISINDIPVDIFFKYALEKDSNIDDYRSYIRKIFFEINDKYNLLSNPNIEDRISILKNSKEEYEFIYPLQIDTVGNFSLKEWTDDDNTLKIENTDIELTDTEINEMIQNPEVSKGKILSTSIRKMVCSHDDFPEYDVNISPTDNIEDENFLFYSPDELVEEESVFLNLYHRKAQIGTETFFIDNDDRIELPIKNGKYISSHRRLSTENFSFTVQNANSNSPYIIIPLYINDKDEVNSTLSINICGITIYISYINKENRKKIATFFDGERVITLDVLDLNLNIENEIKNINFIKFPIKKIERIFYKKIFCKLFANNDYTTEYKQIVIKTDEHLNNIYYYSENISIPESKNIETFNFTPRLKTFFKFDDYVYTIKYSLLKDNNTTMDLNYLNYIALTKDLKKYYSYSTETKKYLITKTINEKVLREYTNIKISEEPNDQGLYSVNSPKLKTDVYWISEDNDNSKLPFIVERNSALRGETISDTVFFEKRKTSLKNSLKDLFSNDDQNIINLKDEFLNEDGAERLYNYAKSISNISISSNTVVKINNAAEYINKSNALILKESEFIEENTSDEVDNKMVPVYRKLEKAIREHEYFPLEIEYQKYYNDLLNSKINVYPTEEKYKNKSFDDEYYKKFSKTTDNSDFYNLLSNSIFNYLNSKNSNFITNLDEIKSYAPDSEDSLNELEPDLNVSKKKIYFRLVKNGSDGNPDYTDLRDALLNLIQIKEVDGKKIQMEIYNE